MSVIAEHLGVNPKNVVFKDHELLPGVGNIGIEVELENLHKKFEQWPRPDGWVLKGDGSLRDGMEYIFDGPQSGDDALSSIKAIAKAFGENGVDPTFRCSTHIHLDVRDMEFVKYERLVLAYMVFEDVFFDHCQPHRRQSNFCIPFLANDWLSNLFGRKVLAARTDGRKFQGASNWPKYSALNLQVTANFGSIEFRGMHGTVDEAELIALSQRMLYLKRYVMEDKSETHHEFLDRLLEENINNVFPAGLRDGYVMEPGAKEQGISTALHSLLVATMTEQGDFLADFGAAPDVGRQLRDTMRRNINTRCRWNLEFLRSVNIQVPMGNATIQAGINVMCALNRLNGVNVTLRQVLDNPSVDVGILVAIRGNLQVLRDDWGYDVTLENMQ